VDFIAERGICLI